jgi:hypothetical protein
MEAVGGLTSLYHVYGEYTTCMAQATCQGPETASTKVDRGMRNFLDTEAEERGICRAEFIRRLFDVYQENRMQGHSCPKCGENIVLPV